MERTRTARLTATFLSVILLLVSALPAANAFHDPADARDAGHATVDYGEATYESATKTVNAGSEEAGGPTPAWENQTRSTLTHVTGEEGGTVYDAGRPFVDSWALRVFYAFYAESGFYDPHFDRVRYTSQNATIYAEGERMDGVAGFAVSEGIPHPCEMEGAACVTVSDGFAAGHVAVDLLP